MKLHTTLLSIIMMFMISSCSREARMIEINRVKTQSINNTDGDLLDSVTIIGDRSKFPRYFYIIKKSPNPIKDTYIDDISGGGLHSLLVYKVDLKSKKITNITNDLSNYYILDKYEGMRVWMIDNESLYYSCYKNTSSLDGIRILNLKEVRSLDLSKGDTSVTSSEFSDKSNNDKISYGAPRLIHAGDSSSDSTLMRYTILYEFEPDDPILLIPINTWGSDLGLFNNLAYIRELNEHDNSSIIYEFGKLNTIDIFDKEKYIDLVNSSLVKALRKFCYTPDDLFSIYHDNPVRFIKDMNNRRLIIYGSVENIDIGIFGSVYISVMGNNERISISVSPSDDNLYRLGVGDLVIISGTQSGRGPNIVDAKILGSHEYLPVIVSNYNNWIRKYTS